MSQEEVKQFYKYVDVLVCPSRDDPLPIVVSQALQNGIPCIVSNEVGQSEFLVDEKGGMVVPAEDANALAIAMTKYIKDEGWIKESSKGAKEIFESHFSEQVMRKNLEEIVCELIEM